LRVRQIIYVAGLPPAREPILPINERTRFKLAERVAHRTFGNATGRRYCFVARETGITVFCVPAPA